jgi:hypothetical protein
MSSSARQQSSYLNSILRKQSTSQAFMPQIRLVAGCTTVDAALG